MTKLLVADATCPGSTAEVAGRIADRLCAAGMSTEAQPVENVPDPGGCDAAVLGSGNCYGGWLATMKSYVEAHRAELSRMPVAFFTLHMFNLGDTPATLAQRGRYAASARSAVTPVEGAFFAGRVDPTRLSLVERLAVRFVGSPVGDLRDWPRIEAWADTLPSKLFTT